MRRLSQIVILLSAVSVTNVYGQEINTRSSKGRDTLSTMTAVVQSALGERVRLTYRPGPHARVERFVGRLTQANSDSLSVHGDDHSIVVPLPRVDQLEISRGQTSHTGTGALVGLIGGGVILGAIAASSASECEGLCIGPTEPEPLFLIGALVGGLGGAAVGALMGSAIRVDRWEQVPLDGSLGLSTGSGAPAVTMRLRF